MDVDGVEFKVKGLKINSEIDHDDDLPAPPPLPNNNDYPTVRVTTTQSYPVDNDLLPPPPPPSLSTDYLWSPPDLTAGQVGNRNMQFIYFFLSATKHFFLSQVKMLGNTNLISLSLINCWRKKNLSMGSFLKTQSKLRFN